MGIFDKLFGRKREKEEKRDKHKEDWSFYSNRANTYLKEGKFTEAIVDYTKAIESYHEPFWVGFLQTQQQLRYFRGISYYYKGLSTHSKDDFEHAIEDLSTIRVFMPRHNGTVGPYEETYAEKWANATLMCGDASLEIGDYDAAINYYTELDNRWTPEVVQSLSVTHSDIERKCAIAERKRKTALTMLKGRRDVEGLIKVLGHEDAATALGEIGKPAVEPLTEALKDEYSSVRWNAVWALGKIGDSRAVEPLTEALKDEDCAVREWAAEALEKIKAKKS